MSETKLELYELLGIITNAKRAGKGNLLTVTSVNTKKTYKVECPFFCPARQGDIVSGYCLLKENGNMEFVQEPIVEPSTSKENVQTAFIIALRGTRFSRRMSERLYDFFEEEAKRRIKEIPDRNDPVIRNKDMLSAAVLEMISLYAHRFKLSGETVEPLMQVGLTEEQAERLLRWWYRTLTLRRLYLLGLTKREIRESCERGWSPNDLYYQLIENPYIPEKVSIEKARSISRRYRLSYGQDMDECGQLVRFVDGCTTERGWACYPVYALAKKFPRFDTLQPILKRHFKCAIRYDFFYLRHQAETEDLLTTFLQSEELPETHCSDATKKRLDEEQVIAVERALNNTVSIITGGAGTGKTITIAALADELDIRNEPYLIASFTGKAVSRIKEVVRRKSTVKTLHMILSGAVPNSVTTLIIDEASMVPNELLARVLAKIAYTKKHFRIVLVGDPNQIQPIEWGDLFNRLLLVEGIPTTNLLIDHRRVAKSVLYQNARCFITGEPFRWGSDCQFVEGGVPEIESIVKAIYMGGVPHEEITVISPFNRDLEEINRICQNIFLDKDAPVITDAFGKVWKLGARVMMTVNRYDIGVMNGEEGLITGIYPERNEIKVRFKKEEEIIPTYLQIDVTESDEIDDIDEPLSTKLLVLSWAITVHKSQGSEWRYTIFYLSPNSARTSFINRKLLYTGVSRAKEMLYVVSQSEQGFQLAMGIDPPKRYDHLDRRLKGENPVCQKQPMPSH